MAKELKNFGKKDGAARVEKFPKPTRAAWALNRVAVRNGAAVDELLAAGISVSQAQQRVLTGDLDPQELRTRVEKRRLLIRRLTDEAVRESSQSQRNDIVATLEAASNDADVGKQLRRGRLTKAARPDTGFGDLAEMFAPGPARRPPKTDPAKKQRLERRLQQARRDLDASQKRLEHARRQLEDAKRDLADAESVVQRDTDACEQIAAELEQS